MLLKVYCHYCQSSGSTNLALLLTASQVVESKVDRGIGTGVWKYY